MSSSTKWFGLVVVLALFVLSGGNHETGLAQAGKTITVCTSGCDFAAIQAAVDAASAGDTVEVQAGTYLENVAIQERQDLILKSAGSDQVTLDGSAGVADQKPAIFIEKSQNITIQGFKIINSRRAIYAVESTELVLKNSQLEDNVRQGIFLERSQAELTDSIVTKTKVDQDGINGIGAQFVDSQVVMKNSAISENADRGISLQGENNPTLMMDNCTVSSNRTLGVSLYQSAQATINNSRITGTKTDAEGNNGIGVYAGGNSKAAVQKSTINNNKGQGVYLADNANATLDDNTVTGNTGWGIYAGDTVHAQITNNQITTTKPVPNADYGWGYGISVYKTAQVTLQGNTFSQNSSYGIVLRDNSQVTILKNTISNNGSSGLVLFENSKATLDDNTISGNVVAGIDLFNTAQATIANNRVTGTKKDANGNNGLGIAVEGDSKATIQNSTIEQNALYGVFLRDNAQATIQKNTIANNSSRGVHLTDASKATLDGNTITGNIGHGIVLFGSAQATITNNQITGNKPSADGSVGGGQGIAVDEASRATITNNTIKSNTANGIILGSGVIQNESSQAEISNNTIQNNSSCGVFSDPDSGIKITGGGNTISSNTKGQLCGTTSKFPRGFGGGK